LKEHKAIPPALAQKLLVAFLRDDLAEEVLGDLDEKFYSGLKTRSVWKAKLGYWYQVINYLRPFAIRKSKSMNSNLYAMYKSYFKIGWRNLIKNKGYSFINIGGLAIGLACCILIGLYTWDEYNYDRFHSQFNNIYRVVDQQIQGGSTYNVAVTPGPLADALKNDFPEVLQTCRLGKKWNGILQVDSLYFEPKDILATDNSFFSLFNFKLTQGNSKKALLGPDEVVISETLAAQIFGPDWQYSNKVLGQQIQFNKDRTLTLVGIVQDPPLNSHLQFDVLLSLRFDELDERSYNWFSNNYHTYILVNPEADAKALNVKLYKHLTKFLPDTNITLSLQALSDIYLYSKFDFQTDWSKTSDVVYIQIFLAVGLIVLLIAIFNFINLSTARALSRAKEVGVRKVIGAIHKQLIAQFLSESLLITFLSVGLALIILQFFLPLLNDISGKSLYVPFNDPYFDLTIIGFTVITGVMAGTYPAFYLSNFKPVKVLKGFFAIHSGQLFRRTLVVGQFMFSVILIIGTIVIYKQLEFLQNKNLGFDKSQLLYVNVKNAELRAKALLLKSDLQEQTSIAGVATTSTNLVDVINSTGQVKWEGQDAEDQFLMTQINIDPDFLSTTGMELVAGRNFNPSIPSDTASAYIINETAAKRMGWTPQEALGKTFTLWSYPGTIIGVVKDFHFRPMTTTIEPFLFHYWPRESCRGLFVKLKANHVHEAIAAIEKLYKKYDQRTAPSYQFVNDVLEHQYRTEQNTGRIVLHFSILAILISALGLFGLATYAAEQRTREIGVRKVLGASVISIVNLLSRDFLKLVCLAILVASPIAWWSMNQWLQDFAYRINIEWWIFLLSGLFAVAIALLTVSFQSIKAALTNPVKSLRSE